MISDEAGLKQYMREICFPGADDATVQPLVAAYPPDPAQGCPYDTGTNNAGNDQFKRIAAFQGDFGIHWQRRFFLENRKGKADGWSYCKSDSEVYAKPES